MSRGDGGRRGVGHTPDPPVRPVAPTAPPAARSDGTGQGEGRGTYRRLGASRTARDREQNRRDERSEDLKADKRRGRPSVPEQQMLGVLATLGERYGEDYTREHKITAGDGWYVAHVDFAWPRDHLVIEVYGGPHYKPFFDPGGDRDSKEARRIQAIESVGWEVLIVRDYEMKEKTWLRAVEKVTQFLDAHRGQWPGQERQERQEQWEG